MRFSVVTAAIAAPLVVVSSSVQQPRDGSTYESLGRRTDHLKENLSSNKVNNEKSYGNSAGGVNQVVNVVQKAGPEVVLIWVNNGGGAATSTITQTVTQTVNGQVTASAVSTAPGTGTTHSVIVGGSAGLVYTPSEIKAAVGDMVEFTFMSNNHTVTQSTFDTPCKKLQGGMDTGFVPNVNNTVSPPPKMAMQVTVDTPIWFYCRAATHCGKGMAMSINPTQQKSQAQFQSAAIAQNGTGALAPIQGGAASSASAAGSTETAATAVASTLATAAQAAPSAGASMATGVGSMNSAGQCSCSCMCGVGSFAQSDIQGRGAFGGMPGMIPVAAMEKAPAKARR